DRPAGHGSAWTAIHGRRSTDHVERDETRRAADAAHSGSYACEGWGSTPDPGADEADVPSRVASHAGRVPDSDSGAHQADDPRARGTDVLGAEVHRADDSAREPLVSGLRAVRQRDWRSRESARRRSDADSS